jgi:hypothetical protein
VGQIGHASDDCHIKQHMQHGAGNALQKQAAAAAAAAAAAFVTQAPQSELC